MPCPEITFEHRMIFLHTEIENPTLEILIKSEVVLDKDILHTDRFFLFSAYTRLSATVYI